jgi:hypothetical protein
MRIFNWTREDGRPTREWCRDDTHGTHVPLPLDVSQVSAKAIEVACRANWEASMRSCASDAPWDDLMECERDMYRTEFRAAIAALAQALGEEG